MVSMDLDNSLGGESRKVHLGFAERVIFVIVAIGALSFCAIIWGSAQKLISQVENLTTAQALTSAQVVNMSAQLSDFKLLSSQIIILQTQVTRNTQDIHDIRHHK